MQIKFFYSISILFLLNAYFINPVVSQISQIPQVRFLHISENAFIHNSCDSIGGYGWVWSNGLILVNNHQAFLFDTPVSEANTRKIMQWLHDSLQTELIGFIPNHWHSDCMGGIEVIKQANIPTYANHLTIDIALSKKLSAPNNGFTDSITLKVGKIPFSAYFIGAAHSMDNLVVWVPSENVLFAGCMVKSLQSTSLGFTADGDLFAWPNTLELVLKKFPEAGIVVPGHGNYGDKSLIYHTLQLLKNK